MCLLAEARLFQRLHGANVIDAWKLWHITRWSLPSRGFRNATPARRRVQGSLEWRRGCFPWPLGRRRALGMAAGQFGATDGNAFRMFEQRDMIFACHLASRLRPGVGIVNAESADFILHSCFCLRIGGKPKREHF
jgi:hypothetical protein